MNGVPDFTGKVLHPCAFGLRNVQELARGGDALLGKNP